jgi:hypothetical protein
MACCMTVRDCEPFLPSIFKNIIRLSRLFPDFVLIVAYDHCQDNSESLLKKFQLSAAFPVYLLPSEFTSPHRTVRIAHARNRCLDKLDELDIDIHFMIDADEVNIFPWNLTLIRYYLSNPDWDALSFNRKNYYDIWALMYPPFQHHCWGFFERSREVVEYMKKDIQRELDNCSGMFPCQSAFNGFAMYRTSVFKHQRYSGEYAQLKKLISDESRQNTLRMLSVALSELEEIKLDESFVQSCEHLYYHLSVPHARIYISKFTIL